jgi:hypothetical protein
MRQSKLPIDLRVVMALGIVACVIHFGLIVLLVLGVAHTPEDTRRPVLFGTIVLSSEPWLGIYDSVLGLCSVIFVYGLFRRTRWAWWYALALNTYGVVDSAFSFALLPVVVTITMLLSGGMIVWLLCRRGLFQGRNAESVKSG